MIALTLLSAFPFIAASEETATAVDAWTVTVTGGAVRGVIEEGVASFKGIPFAAPPIGELRWKAPQPVEPWDGILEASGFAPSPMQPLPITKVFQSEPPSEDCLYLNVWTPSTNPDEMLPVMVWIYGGAFSMGATSIPVTDGSQLANKGVVVVSIAYRVGPFGFLAHPELSAESGKGSGCYGIQDQIAGLRWVQENIARFGGDPSRVTIFGESAGGMSVNMLSASPLAKGLFHRGISQSGGAMAPVRLADKPGGMLMPSLEYAEAKGEAFLTRLGVADIRGARALTAETISETFVQALMKQEMEMFYPVVDGETIVDGPYDLFERGEFNDTPILLGVNSDDGGVQPLPTPTPEAFETLVRDDFPLAAEEILAAYPHSTNEEAIRSGRDLMREALFAWPSWAWATMQSAKGQGKAYFYYFDYGAPGPGDVPHGADLQYVFGTLDTGLLAGQEGPGASPENEAMSDRMMSYWVNFAATGDPNGPGLPLWPPFDGQAMKTMIFGASPHVDSIPNIDKINVLDTYYSRIRKNRE